MQCSAEPYSAVWSSVVQCIVEVDIRVLSVETHLAGRLFPGDRGDIIHYMEQVREDNRKHCTLYMKYCTLYTSNCIQHTKTCNIKHCTLYTAQ